MLDDPEVNMREEVDALAKYDPKFNETFKKGEPFVQTRNSNID